MSTEVETASEVPPSQEGSQGNGSPSPPPATIAVAPDGEGGLKEEDTGRPSRQQQRQQQHEVGPPAAASSVPAADSSGGSEGSSAPVAEKQSSDVEDDFQYLDIEESDKKEINAAATGEKTAYGGGVAPAEGAGLVASASKELLAKVVRSLSTPMVDGATKPKPKTSDGAEERSEDGSQNESEHGSEDRSESETDSESESETGDPNSGETREERELRRTLKKQSRPTVGREGEERTGGGETSRVRAALERKRLYASSLASSPPPLYCPSDRGQGSAPQLVPQPYPSAKSDAVNALPVMETPSMDDWAGVEDPDWKANHQLGWEQLTDVKEIGKGLTCTVYTARIPGRKAKVVAKVARPRNKGRLEDQAERQLEAEFNVLRQTNHPHVIELLGAGFTPDGRRFLLLEHLPEGTLGTFHALSTKEEMRGPSAYWTLKQGFRRLTKDLRYTLGNLLQVAEALQYLHNDAIPGAVIIHRDIRPDNVGLARGLVVKIFDFGLSRAIVKGHTLVGEVGSLRYSAPEVSMALPHGEKADVYSWALLAWSVTSGRTPFEGLGRSSFYARVVIGGERPAMESGWPKEFQSVLEDCWGRDPSTRPDMTEVVTRMKDILNSPN